MAGDRRASRLLLLIIACLALWLAPGQARAQAGLVGRSLDVCVLRDSGHDNPAALFRHPERFDCTTPQHRLGAGNYWAISTPLHAMSTVDQPLRARVASLWQKGLGLHVLYGDGAIVSTNTDSHGVSRLIQLGAIVEHPIPPRSAPVVRLLWHVDGAANVRGILVGPHLATRAESERSNLLMGALYAAFGGLALALLVYNFSLWVALRYRFQLTYCAMAGLLLAYAGTSSGWLAWLITGLDNNDRLRLNYLLLAGAAAAALMFARDFFEERVFTGWLDRVAIVVSGSIFGAGLLFWLVAPFAPLVADATFAYIFLGLGAVLFPALWRAWHCRSDYLWLFATAWAAPVATAFLRQAANAHVVPWSFWLDNSTILAMAAEAMLSSVAIAYRMKLLSRERDVAVESETVARRLAETDPLTGLLNRRAFLERAIGREGQQRLLLADLDHFKRVNDTLGHDGGDEVLRVFTRVMRASVPASALVARMGGEEFAILASEDEPVEAEAVLARLRATRMPFDLAVTASIGVCSGPLVTEPDWKALYRGADRALFEAKSAGRDRARISRDQALAA
jgi:diguanylate cyclase (GGDEF)-like protein